MDPQPREEPPLSHIGDDIQNHHDTQHLDYYCCCGCCGCNTCWKPPPLLQQWKRRTMPSHTRGDGFGERKRTSCSVWGSPFVSRRRTCLPSQKTRILGVSNIHSTCMDMYINTNCPTIFKKNTTQNPTITSKTTTTKDLCVCVGFVCVVVLVIVVVVGAF